MTKLRPPLSIDAALARIAGTLPGEWKEMASVAGRAESTVRAWGDQDKTDEIPLRCAIALDIAFRKAGGQGRPLFDVHQLLVELAEHDAYPDQADSAREAMGLVHESSGAVGGLIALTLPGATPADEEHAVKQLEELVSAATVPLARLARRRKPPAPP